MTKAELYKKACMLPLLPGVYIIRDKTDTIIYIGKAKRLKTRVSQYFREGVPHDAKVSQMIAHAFTFDVIVCQSEFEALVLEASQIKAHTPKYNILLKDDKGYSYVKVTRGAWPRISAALQKDDDDADYIGPFTSSFAVREEFLPQYYLDGGAIPKTIAVDALPPDADALSEALNQARGTKVELYVPQRGDVAKLVTMAYTNAVERLGRESGRYTREEKLLEEAAQVLGLKKPPRVIESYDISNWGDGSSVCGMVVFRDGRPHRAGYRRFKMKTVAGTDDYASLAETLSRRAAEYEMARRGEKPDGPQNQFATLPDLLLIDGGRGQVGAVKQALRGTALEHVPTFGMVKDDHHRTRAIVDDEGGEIAINRHRNIFTFVTNIQDETHRYANDYRKRAMKKKSYAATLTAIPGVGEKTSAALLAHFKTVSAVKAASISDLEEVKGISHAKAEILYNALRNGV